MRFKQAGNKADSIIVVVHNADTVVIPAGTPLVLNMNATNDGLDVVLPSTANDNRKTVGMSLGVSTKTMQVGDYSEAVVFGLSYNLLLIRQTRASSTNNWASEAARSVGEFLTVDTVNNGFITMASAISAITVSTGAAQAQVGTQWPLAALGATLASYASSASATSDTRTAITAAVRAFVHFM